MFNIFTKILVVVLIFIGEALYIYGEMVAAKSYAFSSLSKIFLKLLLIILVASCFVVSGYIFGYKSFKNIWIVSVVSITSILIMEPILIYLVFHQAPTRGALIGFILGVLGFFSAVFF